MGNFLSQTDLEGVRAVALLLLGEKLVSDKKDSARVKHAFTDSYMIPYESKVLNLKDPADYAIWARRNIQSIRTAESSMEIFNMICSTRRLDFLKKAKAMLSREEFSKMLPLAWISADDPNSGEQVSISTVATWFKQADKEVLMTDAEREYLNSLSDTVVIYRGVAPGRVRLGLSWTPNKEIAERFGRRRLGEGQGYLLTAIVPKNRVLAYLNSAEEEELIVKVTEAEVSESPLVMYDEGEFEPVMYDESEVVS